MLHLVGRRRFLAGAGALLAAPCVARGQPQVPGERVRRVAFIAGSSPLSELTGQNPVNPAVRAFVHRLRDLGYVEGRTLQLDMRTLEGRFERSAEVVGDVVRFKPDVIVMPSLLILQRGFDASVGVPIVVIAGGGLVESGLVRSLARPGGSVTGVLVDVDSGVEAKRLELLREVAPNVARIAFLGSPRAWDSPWGRGALAGAQRLGLNLFPVARGDTGADYDEAFALIARDRPDAVFVPTGPVSFGQRERIGRFLAESRIPSICAYSEVVEHGCLISYASSVGGMLSRAADYVARILQGSKPGDLPIEQPASFELVVNLKTAKALGIRIPQSVLLRADRVID